jgi:Uma2 family endonuclease
MSSSALRLPPRRMTVPEFLDWAASPAGGAGASWQLRDGEPEMMAPASDAHGSLQGELAFRIIEHLARTGRRCRAVVTPGVVPRLRSERNMLVPDIGVTCAPPSGGASLPEPLVLVEVLSPSNEAATRANVWAYATIPSVAEIVLVSSTAVAAEMLRRRPDGSWPEQPEAVGAGGALRIEAIGFEAPLAALYRTTTLAAGG